MNQDSENRNDELVVAAAQLGVEVIGPQAASVDSSGKFPTESIAALGGRGLLGLCVGREHGGLGAGMRTFAGVAEEIATHCSSTAMIFIMHTVAAHTIEASETLATRAEVLRDIAAGKHLTTLALSEKGSRSQFWAPVSAFAKNDAGYVTNARKSFVTSAHHAHSYVSSAQAPDAKSPLESVLYLLRPRTNNVRVDGAFDGMGLRGNDSAAVTIENLPIAEGELLTPLGEGAKGMLEVILPWFCVGTAAMSNGLARAAVTATRNHISGTKFEHTNSQLRDLPNLRARLAEMSVKTEASRALLAQTVQQLEAGSPQAALSVLQTRLAALEAACAVTDLALKTCGGAAFSRHLSVERLFRDSRAGWVMAPTADHLADFIGKALAGLPLF